MYKSRVSPLLTFKNCCVRRRIGTIIFCKYWLLINQIDRNYSCFVITTHSKCKIIYLKLTVMENYNSFLEYYHTKAFFKLHIFCIQYWELLEIEILDYMAIKLVDNIKQRKQEGSKMLKFLLYLFRCIMQEHYANE